MTGSYDTGTHFYNTIITLNNLNVQDFTSPLTKIIDLSDIFINEHTHCSVFLSGFVFGWFKVERVIYVSPVGQQISDNQRIRHTFSTLSDNKSQIIKGYAIPIPRSLNHCFVSTRLRYIPLQLIYGHTCSMVVNKYSQTRVHRITYTTNTLCMKYMKYRVH
mgnify:CR=1 FL=1